MFVKGGSAMKKWMLTLAIALVVSAAAMTRADAVSVRVGTAEVKTGVVLINSTTYVPLRTVSSLLRPDAQIAWTNGQAAVTAPGVSLTARPGDLYLQANERCLFAAEGVRLAGGRTLVPVRALAKAFGAAVSWDSAAQRASVTPGSGTILSGDQFYDGGDVYWLSRIISAESAGEPMLGKIAVGNVISNRVASPDYPDTIYDVIFDTKYGVQFEPTGNGTIYQTPTAESVTAARLCLDGASVVGGSLYFFNPATAGSSWIARSCTYYGTIGNHRFYT